MVSYAAPESRGVSSFCSIAAWIGATTVAAATLLFSTSGSAAGLTPWTGPSPPAFALPQFGGPQGESIALSSQHGDVILVHFFASWCEPCRDELPALQRLADRGTPSLRVLAIAVADSGAPLNRLIDATGVTFPVLMDRDRAVARAWTVSTLPSTVVLDSRHVARLFVESDFAWDTIEPTRLIERAVSQGHDVQQSLVIQGGQPHAR
ncbi:MAG: TlpA family protein disulfide reductase [Proteobacteria bacterium]|nr:TlpA family protein disulfide reductase [Pseudomonadota bacterium]